MENFKGTKGKWKYSVKHRGSTKKSLIQVEIPNNLTLLVGEIGLDDCTVASCCNVEQHANALLISKSPEILEILTKVLSMYTNTDKPSTRLILEAQQLIKEATNV